MLGEVHHTLYYFPHCKVCQVTECNFFVSVILTVMCCIYNFLEGGGGGGGGEGGERNVFIFIV
jgi:hypothetical protein